MKIEHHTFKVIFSEVLLTYFTYLFSLRKKYVKEKKKNIYFKEYKKKEKKSNEAFLKDNTYGNVRNVYLQDFNLERIILL